MNITLKGLHILGKNSEETLCMEAKVCLDGQAFAIATNDGHGGETFIMALAGKEEVMAKVVAWARAQPAEIITEIGGEPLAKPFTLDFTLEGLVDKLATETWNAKERAKVEARMRRDCQKKTLFRLEGDSPDEYRWVNCPWGDKAKEYLDKKYGAKVKEILNLKLLSA